MSTSTGKTGRGVTFEIGDGQSPPTFTAVANAVSINNSGRDAEQIDFTHLASTGGFREFRQGFKDPGSIAVEYHLDPTDSTHQDILAKWISGTVFEWRVNFVTAGWNVYLVGSGFMQNPGDINVTVNDPIRGTSTIRVTGQTSFEDA